MKILLASLFAGALIYLAPHTQASPSQLNNVATSTKVQTVQAEAPRKEPTATLVRQEKAPTEPVGAPLQIKQLSPHESLMKQAGIPESDWQAVDYIVRHESSWNAQARNTSSGSFGLCQAYPARKMASAGEDYMTNPVTQLRWCHSYAVHRYGGWWSSFAVWRSQRWW